MTMPLQAWYERLVLRHPLAAIAVVILLAVAMALGLPNFKIDASADSLTLEHDTDLDYYRSLSQRYGSTDFLVVTFKPRQGDLFNDANLQTLKQLTEELAGVDGVIGVQSIVNLPLLFSPKIGVAELKDEPRTLLTAGVDREAAKKEFLTSPVYRHLILGPDGETTGILASFEVDEKALNMVRHRDALRLQRDTQGLTPEQQIELDQITEDYLNYRTAKAVVERARVDAVRNLMHRYRDRAELFLGGPSMITADMVDYVARDMKYFGAGVVVFIILALTAIFRQLRWVLLPLASCLLTLLIMLGGLSWADWRLTVISSNFVLVLLVITMALTIHLIVRYREYHWKNPDAPQFELVSNTVATMTKPCLYTALTTMVAFVSLVVSDIRPVIDFGWMMTIGLTVAFVLVFVLIPSGILLWGKKPVRHRVSEDTPFTLKFSAFTERHGTLVLVISSLVAVASVVGIARLQVDNRFIDYFRSDTEIHQGLAVIDANLGGTTPFDIVIRAPQPAVAAPTPEAPASSAGGNSARADTLDGQDAYGDAQTDAGSGEYGSEDDPFAAEDPFATEAPSAADDPFATDDPFAGDDPFGADSGEPAAGGTAPAANNGNSNSYWFARAGLDDLEKLHNYLESLPEIGKVSSLVTLFDVANELTGHRMNDFELAFARQSLSPEIRDLLVAPYLDDKLGETRVSMRTVETASDLKRADLLAQINRFMTNEMGLDKDQYRFSGLLVLYNNMLQSLYRSQILTMGAVFLGIMVMFLVLFRSVKVSLLAITPSLLAAMAVLGGMGLAGVPLDMMTITVASITVGIGVDNSIHYIHRFKVEFAEDRNYLAAMHRAHGSIGRALFYTSIIIVFGFSILSVSNFIPSIYFGFLTGVAMLMALLGALALLPKLILVFKPFGPPAQG